MQSNKEYVAAMIDLLMDHFGDQVVFEVLLDTWEPLESVRDAINARIDKRDYKRRRNRIRYNHRDILLAVDNNTCQYCGKKVEGKEAEIDHIIPVDGGGQDTFENMVTSCTNCNKTKGTKLKDLDPRKIEDKRRAFIKSGVFDDISYAEFKQEYERDGKVKGRDRFNLPKEERDEQ
jgi:hypothetical protein